MNRKLTKQDYTRLAPLDIRLLDAAIQVEDDRTGTSVETLKRAFVDNLYYIQGKDEQFATLHDYYMAIAHSVRDRLIQRRIQTAKTYAQKNVKTVYYLSAEFLMGRYLGNSLINLGLHENIRQVLQACGLDLAMLLEREKEPGLGNGGLGRLEDAEFCDRWRQIKQANKQDLADYILHQNGIAVAPNSLFDVQVKQYA